MPELPEVETIRRHLERTVIGRTIQGLTACWPGVIQEACCTDLGSTLAGRSIESVGRRGKFLAVRLSGGLSLIIHLRMTGCLLLQPAPAEVCKHTRAVIHLDGGTDLVFRDQRKFGRVWLVRDEDRVLGKLGPEPLENGFTAEYLAGIISGRRAPIKNLILDQQAIAGIGNMYADEALHRACVHPTQPGEDLSPAEIQRLHEAIKFVLHKGISDGGASVNTYFHPDGQSGKAQEAFKVAHGGSGSCLTCGTRLARMVVGGRGTYYCPACQDKGS